MNKAILHQNVQAYVDNHLNTDVHQLAMRKSPFPEVSARELAVQIISKKKTEKKLPTWFQQPNIYYPETLSIEQCSSEKTAAYKASLLHGKVIDLTGGFGVDTYYFSKSADTVIHCEINQELSEIAQYNATVLGITNTTYLNTDGLAFLQTTEQEFDTIYVDPARRSDAGKVFMLEDCSPNVVEQIDLLLRKARQVIIKTSPLLDITAGLRELRNVKEVHIVSTKNECKELLFVLVRNSNSPVKLISTTINEGIKQFTSLPEDVAEVEIADRIFKYLYEPDVALLKSGAFNLIGQQYGLQKLHDQTQLYTSAALQQDFPGRIFNVEEIISGADLKKAKDLKGNVIVRSYPGKAADLVKKYKIKPSKQHFLIFTLTKQRGIVIVKATINQYY